MNFVFRSSVGTFEIHEKDGRWQLWIDDELLGSYHSPEAAADDVYTQHTGWSDWDDRDLDGMEPAGLSEWERVRR